MEIGVFDCLFGDLSPKGSSDAPGVVVSTLTGLLRGELRWSLSKGGNSYRFILGLSEYMGVLVFTPVLNELWHFLSSQLKGQYSRKY